MIQLLIQYWLYIWVVASAIIAIVGSFLSGYDAEELDMSVVLLMAVIWPLIIAFLLACLPFWLLAELGRWCRKRKRK